MINLLDSIVRKSCVLFFASAHGCTLVTHNTSEFGRVPGLPLDDWELP
jgi:hypothetical protein